MELIEPTLFVIARRQKYKFISLSIASSTVFPSKHSQLRLSILLIQVKYQNEVSSQQKIQKHLLHNW